MQDEWKSSQLEEGGGGMGRSKEFFITPSSKQEEQESGWLSRNKRKVKYGTVGQLLILLCRRYWTLLSGHSFSRDWEQKWVCLGFRAPLCTALSNTLGRPQQVVHVALGFIKLMEVGSFNCSPLSSRCLSISTSSTVLGFGKGRSS